MQDARGGLCQDERVSDDSAEPSSRATWHVGRLIIAWAVAAVIGVLVTVLVAGGLFRLLRRRRGPSD